MGSQLGRMILEGGAVSGDEMEASPDQSGDYGPLDEIVAEVAAGIEVGRRSGARSSHLGESRVSPPSR